MFVDDAIREAATCGRRDPFWVWLLLFLGPLGIVALVLAAVLAPGAWAAGALSTKSTSPSTIP